MAGNLSSNNTGRSHKRRRNFRPSSDINVTPLVDVMLVLLIVFMVTAPMLTVGVPVDLPKTQAAQLNDQAEPLVVSVDSEGKTYFQENELPLSEILKKLADASGGKPDTKIYVRGDKKLPYGQIMETMGAIAAAGFSRVSLIAEMPMQNQVSPKISPKIESRKPEKMAASKNTLVGSSAGERPKLALKNPAPAGAQNRARPPL